MRTTKCLGFILLAANIVNANESRPLSTISLPVEVNLSAIEAKINAEVPDTLEVIDQRGQTCVEAEWLKTKGIPKCSMKGIKIYCKDTWLKTKVTPDISCDVSGWVKRNGKIRISGSGQRLSFAIPLKAKVTARGRGGIGKNITQSVEAAPTIFADMIPGISHDWKPFVHVDTNFTWDKRPEIKLFNLIPVSVGSQVEPELRKELDKFEKTLPDVLSSQKLKQRVQIAWADLQKPIELDIDRNISMQFEPVDIGFSGLDTQNNITKAVFWISGYPNIHVDGAAPAFEARELPDLKSSESPVEGFDLVIPIRARLDELSEQANDELSDLGEIELEDYGFKGSLEIENVELSGSRGELELSADFILDEDDGFWDWIDIFGFFDIEGRIIFFPDVTISKDEDRIFIDDIRFDASTNSSLADALIDLANLKPLRSFLASKLAYDFSEKLDGTRALLGKELKRDISDELKMTGSVDSLSIGDIAIGRDYLTLPVYLSGSIEMKIGL